MCVHTCLDLITGKRVGAHKLVRFQTAVSWISWVPGSGLSVAPTLMLGQELSQAVAGGQLHVAAGLAVAETIFGPGAPVVCLGVFRVG